MSGQLALALSERTTGPAAVWDTLPSQTRAQVTIALARLLAKLIEEGRDE